MTDYYASPSGTGDGSIGSPCSFVTGATLGSAGDTLFLRTGTYTGLESASGNATFSSGSSFANAYTVKNYPGETVTITAGSEFCLPIENCSYVIFDGLILDGNGALNCAKIRFFAHHIRMQNCEMKNSTYTGVLLPDESPDNTVQGDNEFINLIVHDNGTRARYDHGIYMSVPNNLVEHCEFYNNAAFGIQMDQGTSENNTIRFNRSHDNARISSGDDGGGIVVADGANNKVYNNLFYNNGAGDGIYVAYGAVDALIYNNTCIGNGYFYTGTRGEVRNNIFTNGLRLELTSSITVTNNLTDSTITRISDTGSTLANNLIGAAEFISTNDYHLQVSSPAKDSGIDLSATISAVDYDGVSRPQGSAWDMGAYEFISNGTIRLAYRLR